MSKAVFFVAGALLFSADGQASAQGPAIRECEGDYRKVVSAPPYDFVMTSRVVTDNPTYDMVVSCIQNRVEGYFRWRWHVPGHYASFNKPGINENYRPVRKFAGLNPIEGCFVYGNLNATDKAFFHADPSQFAQLEREKSGCPTKFGYLLDRSHEFASSIRMAQSSTSDDSIVTGAVSQKAIPNTVDYEQELSFFIDNPAIDKDVSRASLRILFSRDQEGAVVSLRYKLVLGAKAENVEAFGLVLKPIGEGEAFEALKKSVTKKFGKDPIILKRVGDLKLSFGIGTKNEFGSAQFGIFTKKSELVTTFWVPVIF